MAEFLTMEDAERKFGSKSKTNAGMTLGIVGTALAALNGGIGGGDCCCGGGGGGLLGGILGGNKGGNCCLAEKAMQTAMAQGQIADNLAWSNRVQSMNDDINLYTYVNGNVQALSNQNYEGRIVDQREKCNMYVDLLSRDNAQNLGVATAFANSREKDVQEKAQMFTLLSARINELEKKEVATATALPLMFELAEVKGTKYADACCCKAEKDLLIANSHLQRQLDRKVDGQLGLPFSSLITGIPQLPAVQYMVTGCNDGRGATTQSCM